MADISAITALDGVTYSIKDSEAREHLVPTGGTTGQVLTKTASGYDWQTGGSGGSAVWGDITGTLSNQTDLNNELTSIRSNIATIESSPATVSHTAGEYLVWNGQLYTVTSAIAVGETLTAGTNIASTNVGSELTALNAGLNVISKVVVSSSSPVDILLKNYGSMMLIGFVQNVGSVILGVSKEGSTLNVRNLLTSSAFSNTNLTFTANGDYVTISSTAPNGSRFTVIAGGNAY